MFSLDDLVSIILKIMDAKDDVLYSHSLRVGYYSAQIARLEGCQEDECQVLRVGGILHDIGKLGIPDSILKKPGKLTIKEFEIIRTHTDIGYNILKQIKPLKRFADIAKNHHLRPDEKGYPATSNGSKQYKKFKYVHRHTRIVTVADVFDVLWAGRSYSERKSLPWIVKEFNDNIDKQFDGKAVEALIQYLKHRYGEDALVEEVEERKIKKAA